MAEKKTYNKNYRNVPAGTVKQLDKLNVVIAHEQGKSLTSTQVLIEVVDVAYKAKVK